MLTLQYIPYQQLSPLSTQERVQLILSALKSDKIVLIDGRLTSSDEASLIRETMSNIDNNFNGIEIGVMYNHKEVGFISKLKHKIARALIGDRNGITFIGPAKIISELRQHPENIELSFQKDYLVKHSKSNTYNINEGNETFKSKVNNVRAKTINKKLR